VNRLQERLLGGRDKDKEDVRRGLFERFQKGVLGARGHGVRRVHDDHPVAALKGIEGDRLLDVAHLVDADRLVLRAFFAGAHADRQHVGVDAGGDAPALAALAARGRTADAVDRLRQSRRRRRLAHTWRAGQHVSVRRGRPGQGPHQGLHRALVADQPPAHAHRPA
jgi:hypothetical protein